MPGQPTLLNPLVRSSLTLSHFLLPLIGLHPSLIVSLLLLSCILPIQSTIINTIMPFNITPVRPLKRRAADDDELPYTTPVKHLRLDFDIDDNSDSTSNMEIDDMGLTTTSDNSDYQMMTTPEPESLQRYYYGPGVIAFPRSLQVFDVPNCNWYWNASCWVNNRQLDAVEINQICTSFQSSYGSPLHTGSLPAIQLGTSEDMIGRATPRFSTFIVFPCADAEMIRSEEFMRVWTDQVMVPSVLQAARKRGGFSSGVPAYAKSYKAIKMASDCQRIVSVTDVPDTPISVRLRGEELGDLWESMQRIVKTESPYWEFQDMFIVVVAGKDSETGMQCYGSDLRKFWSHFSINFDRAINMEHVAPECVTISPKECYGLV
jgi:hypothetical protein